MRSGDRPGLQNRRAASSMLPVCSTHTRFRHYSATYRLRNHSEIVPCHLRIDVPSSTQSSTSVAKGQPVLCRILPASKRQRPPSPRHHDTVKNGITLEMNYADVAEPAEMKRGLPSTIVLTKRGKFSPKSFDVLTANLKQLA
jgi:hypothetical protein